MERYKRFKIVGQGSFGFAVLVRDRKNRRYYLMKVVDIAMMSKEQRVQAVIEVDALKLLKNPFVVEYRESFMHNKRYMCIVMKYCPNGDLMSFILKQRKAKKHIEEEKILKIFVQILLALKHIHDAGFIHRDLKSENVFLDSHWNVQVGDFGISKKLEKGDIKAETIIGTPYYLPPEICQSNPYNQKADIWSLGCILYELCALRHPFDANSINGLVIKITRGEFEEVPSKYSNDLKRLIHQMLEIEPEDRPSVAQIFKKRFLKKTVEKVIRELEELQKSFNKKNNRKNANLINMKDFEFDKDDVEEGDKENIDSLQKQRVFEEDKEAQAYDGGGNPYEGMDMQTISEMIEVKRFELEKVLGFEKMLQIYEAFKREGKLSEVSEEINLMFKELVDLEEFFFNN